MKMSWGGGREGNRIQFKINHYIYGNEKRCSILDPLICTNVLCLGVGEVMTSMIPPPPLGSALIFTIDIGIFKTFYIHTGIAAFTTRKRFRELFGCYIINHHLIVLSYC